MLNSMHLGNSHYSLKLKSMFDLAIATHRFSPPQQPQLSYPIQAPQLTSTHIPMSHHHSIPDRKEQLSSMEHSISINNPTNVRIMEESGGGLNEDHDMMLMYPSSPQSENSPKSQDSLSPVSTADGSCSANIPNRGQMSPAVYSNPMSQPDFINQGIMSTSGNVGGVYPEERLGAVEQNERQTSKKLGPGSNKPSFSIESLLAHSNSWRRHPQHPDSKGIGKDNRFSPYAVPPQVQQGRCVRHVVDTKTSNATSQNEEKQSENFSGSSKASNGRRAAKSKRVRTIFTPEQLERLEAEFERQQYMVGPERLYLASSLYLTEAQVKVWFQNRRIKWRKQHLEMEQQRLAIYRSIAEQDMMTAVEPEDSVDCDYEDDEGSDEEGHSTHSPPQPPSLAGSNLHTFSRSCTSSLQPDKVTVSSSHSTPSPALLQLPHQQIPSIKQLKSGSTTKSDVRRPQSTAEEYQVQVPLSTTASSSSAILRTPINSRSEADITCATYSRNAVIALKK